MLCWRKLLAGFLADRGGTSKWCLVGVLVVGNPENRWSGPAK